MLRQIHSVLAHKISTILPHPNPIASYLLSCSSNELNTSFSRLDTSFCNVLDRDILYSQFDSGLPKVFHVLCSGESLPKTLPLIRDDEGTAALNLSGILGSDLTFYFIESFQYGGQRQSALKRIQTAILNAQKPQYVIAKSLDAGYIDLRALSNLLSPNKLYCIRDAQCPFGFIPWLKSSADGFSKVLYEPGRSFFIRSIQSITLILDFLSLLGTQKIILHGFDGHGSHYYAIPEFVAPSFLQTKELQADMMLLTSSSNSTCRAIRTSQIRHLTALLPFIISRLRSRGSSLYLAKEIGAYREVIPHYW